MTKLIQAQNLSIGWLNALEYLLFSGGKDLNLVVEIERIDQENTHVRQLLDDFLARQRERKGKDFYPVVTVANTLFPQALYNPQRGEKARPFLYEKAEQSFEITRRLQANCYGTYFQRMIAWSGKQRKVNQLETIIQRLHSGLKRSNPLSSAYEIGLSDVEEMDTNTEEIRIYQPGKDGRIIGFPCLSHISLTLDKRKLHLTALYRNQYFIQKAYGNFLGLSRLLSFLSQEIGCEPGQLVCIASHADAEVKLGRAIITSLLRQCKSSTVFTQRELFERNK